MTHENVYKLRDHPDFPNEIDVPFATKLQPELICSTCNCVTAAGLKDGNDHVYCLRCAEELTDSSNEFTCCICKWNAPITSLKKNKEEWAILENALSACPNQTKTCSFNGKLRDILNHYKTCKLNEKVECTLCRKLQDIKTLGDHIKNDCPMRCLECNFCGVDLVARDKVRHEMNCDQRPGTCEHCEKNFRTHEELERQHKAVCQLMPVDCSFRELGCDYRATRRDMESHEASGCHNDLLVRKICRLEKENEDRKNSFHQILDNVKASSDNTIQQMERKTAELQESAIAERTLRAKLEERLLTLQNELENHKNSSFQILNTVKGTCDDKIPQMQSAMAELQESANAETTVRAKLEERVLTLQNELQKHKNSFLQILNTVKGTCDDEIPQMQRKMAELQESVHAERILRTRLEKRALTLQEKFQGEMEMLQGGVLGYVRHVRTECETRVAELEKSLEECHRLTRGTFSEIEKMTDARLDAVQEKMKDMNHMVDNRFHGLQERMQHLHRATLAQIEELAEHVRHMRNFVPEK
ncbi:uncharacterized protein [Dermacentor andersoni]|uniref:uncharacterized protein isoform X2 n=1 Tax=Dermacentor andersoni TaxID=34620 RepID=UPI002416315B|nr:TNF receptor-associated factor 2-like isoform X1 [Dermacentor andersoni]